MGRAIISMLVIKAKAISMIVASLADSPITPWVYFLILLLNVYAMFKSKLQVKYAIRVLKNEHWLCYMLISEPLTPAVDMAVLGHGYWPAIGCTNQFYFRLPFNFSFAGMRANCRKRNYFAFEILFDSTEHHWVANNFGWLFSIFRRNQKLIKTYRKFISKLHYYLLRVSEISGQQYRMMCPTLNLTYAYLNITNNPWPYLSQRLYKVIPKWIFAKLPM